MFRDTTDLTRRVMTNHLVMRDQKPLQAKGGLATALLVAVTLASSAVTAASAEQFCTHGGQNPVKGIASHVIQMQGVGSLPHSVRTRSATSVRVAHRLLSHAARLQASSRRLPV
jgi:Flp pilus assembly protein TadB